jgi:hypothetical protein
MRLRHIQSIIASNHHYSTRHSQDALKNFVVNPLKGAAVDGAIDAAGLQGVAGSVGGAQDAALSYAPRRSRYTRRSSHKGGAAAPGGLPPQDPEAWHKNCAANTIFPPVLVRLFIPLCNGAPRFAYTHARELKLLFSPATVSAVAHMACGAVMNDRMGWEASSPAMVVTNCVMWLPRPMLCRMELWTCTSNAIHLPPELFPTTHACNDYHISSK